MSLLAEKVSALKKYNKIDLTQYIRLGNTCTYFSSDSESEEEALNPSVCGNYNSKRDGRRVNIKIESLPEDCDSVDFDADTTGFGDSFTQASSIKENATFGIVTHTINNESGWFTCRYCPMKYTLAGSRYQHERRTHKNKEQVTGTKKRNLITGNDDVIYKHGTLTRPLNVELSDHQQFVKQEPTTSNTPTNEPTDNCVKCGRTFRGRQYLKRHVLHSTTCGSNINNNSGLNQSTSFTPTISESVKRNARSVSVRSGTPITSDMDYFDRLDSCSNQGNKRKVKPGRKSVSLKRIPESSAPTNESENERPISDAKTMTELIHDEEKKKNQAEKDSSDKHSEIPNVSPEDSEEDEAVAAWLNKGETKTSRRKAVKTDEPKTVDVNPPSKDNTSSSRNFNEELLPDKSLAGKLNRSPNTSSSDEIDASVFAWSSLGATESRKRKSEKSSLTKSLNPPAPDDSFDCDQDTQVGKETAEQLTVEKEQILQKDEALSGKNGEDVKQIMRQDCPSPSSSTSEEPDECVSAWSNLGVTQSRKRKRESNNLKILSTNISPSRSTSEQQDKTVDTFSSTKQTEWKKGKPSNENESNNPLQSISTYEQLEKTMNSFLSTNYPEWKNRETSEKNNSPQTSGSLITPPTVSNIKETKPLMNTPPAPRIVPEVDFDDDDDEVQFIEMVPAKAKQNLNSSSSSLTRNDVELSAIPLSAAIFTKALQHPKELMVVWCEILEEDLLSAANMNPTTTLLCIEDLETFRQSDSVKEVLKKTEMINFSILKSGDSTSQWTLISFLVDGSPKGLANKLLLGFEKVEKILEEYASSKQMSVTNMMRHNKEGLFGYLPHRLSGKVAAYNFLQ